MQTRRGGPGFSPEREARALIQMKGRSHEGSIGTAELLPSNLPTSSTAVRPDIMPLLDKIDKLEADTLPQLTLGQSDRAKIDRPSLEPRLYKRRH